MAELQYPIRMVRVRFETTKGSNWTNESEEALQRIKRKLNKLQTLAVPKEGEILMLCLCHKGETISSVLLVEREGIQIPVSYASLLDFSKRFANLMKNNFEMSMMGELKFFLGLQVHQSPRGIFISQSQYAIELLKKHGLDECVSMSTPMATERLDADLQGTPTDQTTYRRMIGGLMYLTASRPDIAFATFVCARYQARPTVKHLKEVKRIFRYLRQSYNMGLWYPKDSGFELIAYSDADHAGCKDDCKSTSGGLQFLGGKLVSWSSKKQDCTAMSTAEAEYVSLSACCAQVIWMRTQLLDYGYKYNRIPMYCDSKSAIAISCNPVQHSKTKHIDIRYHFIKEHVEKVIIMAQQQHAADVHPDELCPPNKRYDLMDANKKVDLDHVQCPSESKILTNIIKNHPLRFSIAASSSIPWIYMARFWHTLMEDGSKYWLRVFPLTQSQPTESTQGTHRTTSTPRSPNPDKEVTESSAPRRSTVIRLRLPEWRSTRLTPPAPVPTVDKADEMILQDTLQVNLVEHEKIEKMVDGQENIVDDSSIPRNDESNIPGTRIEPRSDKESPEVEIAKEKEVEIAKEKEVEISKENEMELTNVVIPVNVNDEDEEIMIRCKKLKRGRKELTDTSHTTSSSSSPHKKLAKTYRLLSLFKTKHTRFKRHQKASSRVTRTLWLLVLHNYGRGSQEKSFDTLADNLHDVMVPDIL
ncbi:retrovirus-related pol polyprotein from transposon TNT 1-94 [Tanacetum coccineum]